jgi:hypothetical protein
MYFSQKPLKLANKWRCSARLTGAQKWFDGGRECVNALVFFPKSPAQSFSARRSGFRIPHTNPSCRTAQSAKTLTD